MCMWLYIQYIHTDKFAYPGNLGNVFSGDMGQPDFLKPIDYMVCKSKICCL